MNSNRIDFGLRPSRLAFLCWCILHVVTLLAVYYTSIPAHTKIIFIMLILIFLVASWLRHPAFRLPRLQRRYSFRDDDSWLIADGEDEYVTRNVIHANINRWWINLTFLNVPNRYSRLVVFRDSIDLKDYELLFRRCKLAKLKQSG